MPAFCVTTAMLCSVTWAISNSGSPHVAGGCKQSWMTKGLTMPLTKYLIPILSLSLIIGCAPDPIMVPDGAADFCDIEEPRRFTQEELDWRAANAPWNLRLDFKTNISWDRECEGAGG
jgi:hypothetical protein